MAARSIPPVTAAQPISGGIDLAAIYLFAIIFYWTPPHFWALALIKKEEYARAGIPMMPVVHGVHRTKLQMLGYTLMLIPLTVLPWLSGTQGLLYALAAVALGGRLLWYCVRMLKETGTGPLAWRMYRFSLAYLALLFVAMGVDRAFPFGRLRQPVQVVLIPATAEAQSRSMIDDR